MGEEHGAVLWQSDPLVMLGDIELERLRSSLERRMFRPSSRPSVATLGRFEIIEKLGRGGMGMVYAARDPDLCRVVALKVLRQDRQDGRATRRMMREARALARLKHPNVVEVYDVGQTASGELFIAMEYIRGPTLRQWLAESRRRRGEILEKFVAVGRGLAAAHSAGVVHRDFKPENVIIGSDGRPRVLDFGLAEGLDQHWPTLDATPPLDPREAAAAPERTTEDAVVEGSDDSLVGTPAYMAPEQLDGARVDPRADQYAFCVALYEALLGRRPFEASSIAQLRAMVRSSKRPSIPCCRVPRRIARVIAKGLSRQPGDRYPSLTALLADLEEARRPPMLSVVLGSAAACVAATLGVWSLVGSPPHPACREGARTPEPEVAAGWFDRWNDEREQFCSARSVEHARALDCLHALRSDLQASLLATDGDPELASPVLEAFPDPSVCRPTASHASRLLHVRIARLRALSWTDQHEAALALGEELLAECRRLGDRAMESEAALLLAQLHQTRLETEQAASLYRAAYFAATEVVHASHALRAAAALATMLAQSGASSAQPWLHRAEQQAERMRSEPAELLLARAAVSIQQGDLDAAEAAIEAFDRLPSAPRLVRSRIERERGRLLLLRSAPEAAEGAYLRSAELLAQHLGPKHARLAFVAEELAAELRHAERWAAAAQLVEHALSVHEHHASPHTANGVRSRLELAELALLRREPETASAVLAPLERLALEPDTLVRRDELLGRVEALRGNHAAAVEHLRAALARLEADPASDPARLIDDHARLAISLARMDMVRDAFEHARKALDAARLREPADASLARAAAAFGDVTLQSGRARAAVAPLEIAVAHRDHLSAAERAQTSFLLAQALVLSHDPSARAETLLRESATEFEAAGWLEDAARVQTWAERSLGTASPQP